jgi:hypothetical protein
MDEPPSGNQLTPILNVYPSSQEQDAKGVVRVASGRHDSCLLNCGNSHIHGIAKAIKMM